MIVSLRGFLFNPKTATTEDISWRENNSMIACKSLSGDFNSTPKTENIRWRESNGGYDRIVLVIACKSLSRFFVKCSYFVKCTYYYCNSLLAEVGDQVLILLKETTAPPFHNRSQSN